MGMMLMPAPVGHCAVCAVNHEDTAPHNQQSIFYQMRFQALFGRGATWADAIAHCSPDIRMLWKKALTERGRWSEPVGRPIAEPYAKSDGRTPVKPGIEPEVVKFEEPEIKEETGDEATSD